jgi:hypothetical protein
MFTSRRHCLAGGAAVSFLLAGALDVRADSNDSSSTPVPARASAQPAQLTPISVQPVEITEPVAASPADRRAWAEKMHHTPAAAQGCFHAAYPSTQWEAVPCDPPPGWRSAVPRRRLNLKEGGNEEVGGTGTFPTLPANNDIVVQATSGHLLSYAEGSFLSVKGVTSESGTGVAAFGDNGILGANEYSLQLNTNYSNSATAACGGFSNCHVWQQYVMATNTPVSLTSSALTDKTQVFIEYWLLNYGASTASTCPTGFDFGGVDGLYGGGVDCVQNTPATTIQSGQLPITDLADLKFSGSATAGGTDYATLTYGGTAYTAQVADNLTDTASVWNQAEFNVFGNAGGSEAVFNNGTTAIVQIAVTDGSTSAPSCVVPSATVSGGSTGESNNFNFVPSTASPVCCPYAQMGSTNPRIQFMEVFDTHAHTASCGSTSIWGEPHISTANESYYNFQAAGEFVALLDPDGTEIQTRQTPIPTSAPGDYDPSGLNNDGLYNCLAMNTAVAAKVGSHRVSYEPSFTDPYATGPFQLRIDGKLTTLGAQGVNLAGGGQVKNSSEGGGMEVDFPDGKIMTAVPGGSYDSMNLLNVTTENLGFVSDTFAAAESGLSGSIPTGSWLPALPNGQSVGAMPATLHERYVTLYDTFANAWRVKANNSLFDYAPKTSTTTFTNTSWPVENAKTCAIPNQKTLEPVSAALAEDACKSVTNKTTHASCVFDVEATGTGGVADGYLLTERVHEVFKIKPIDAAKLVSEVK